MIKCQEVDAIHVLYFEVKSSLHTVARSFTSVITEKGAEMELLVLTLCLQKVVTYVAKGERENERSQFMKTLFRTFPNDDILLLAKIGKR